MNNDLAQMAVRKLVTLLAGYLIGRGIVSSDDLNAQAIELLSGAAFLVVSIAWSTIHQKKLKDIPK